MERPSPGISTRDGGGVGAGGGTKAGKMSSDDDEESSRGRERERAVVVASGGEADPAVTRRTSGSVGKSGLHLAHRHLHPRQSDEEASSSPMEARDTGTTGGDTSTSGSDATLSIHSTVTSPTTSAPSSTSNSNSRPSDTSTSASPASSVSSTTAPLSTTTSGSPITGTSISQNRSSPVVPKTTVTSSVFSTGHANRSSTATTTTASRTTISGTVVIFVYPSTTPRSNSSTSYTSSNFQLTASSSRFPVSNSTRSSTGFFSPTFSTTLEPSNTEAVGGGGGQAPTASTSTVSTTSAAANGSSGGLSLTNQRVIGGVIGGLAGVALLLGLVLFMIKRLKKNRLIQERVDAGYGGPPGPEVSDTGDMAQRSSMTPFAAAASSFFRSPRVSSQASEPAKPEERGFYKVSGRKLPPAIGGPLPSEFQGDRSVAGSSLYRDDESGWAGPTTPVSAGPSGPSRYSMVNTSPSSTAAGSSIVPVTSAISPISTTGPLDRGVPALAIPGPSRIPEEQAEEIEQHSPPSTPIIRPPMFPRQGSLVKDGVGRSLPSHDGSRASRFTEDIV